MQERSREFVNLFKPSVKEEIIVWNGDEAVGISILKDYPDEGKFIPARNGKGQKDSVALIKIGYLVAEENVNVLLHVSIHKASRFLLKGNWDFVLDQYNLESPTRISLEQSKSSKQPIDLEDNSRYQLDLKSKKILDLDKNKFVSPKNIITEIYQTHLKTLTHLAIFFRLKMMFQFKVVNLIPRIIEIFKAMNLFLFGKTIRKTDDLSLGIFKPYPMNYLIALSDERINILGSDFAIAKHTTRTFVVVVLIVFLIHYFTGYDFLSFVELSNRANQNVLFSTTFIGVLVLVFDSIFPYILFFLINILIIFNLWFMKQRFKFK